MYTNPGQCLRLLFPEVHVRVERHLEDLQSLRVVLIIYLAQLHDACRRLLRGEDVEVDDHHLSLQVGQPPCLPVVVRQGDVDDVRHVHLRGIDHHLVLLACYAQVLHPLDGDVVQVLSAHGLGVVGVPAGGHGSEGLDVLSILAGVEDEHVAQRLEQCEIRRGLHRLLVDVVHLHILLIGLDTADDAVLCRRGAEVDVALDVDESSLQVHLLQCQLADGQTVLRTLHLVVGGHRGIFRTDGDGLCRVDAQVDDTPVDTQAVELRSAVGGQGLHRERAVVA